MSAPGPEPRRFRLSARAQSFRYAFRGVGILSGQHNAWIHAAVTAAVVGMGLWLGVGRNSWALLLLAIATVWVAEALNTALELLADAVAPERRPPVGRAKDVAAAAVLLAALGAAGVGLLVLGPPLWSRLFG